MSETESSDLVSGWRATNTETVDLWGRLNEAIHEVVDTRSESRVNLAHGLRLTISPISTPPSLTALHPGALSVQIILTKPGTKLHMERVFHGLYNRAGDVCYYKPSDRKTGDLWRNSYRDPKTGKLVFYKVYGGKLAGILVQSMCRELFFSSLQALHQVLRDVPNANIVGQFHDEIVVDWVPSQAAGSVTLEAIQKIMESAMSQVDIAFLGFPLEADIKHDYRYIK